MDKKKHMSWAQLVADAKYLRSIGVPVDDEKAMGDWIERQRAALALSDEQVLGIAERAIRKAKLRLEWEKWSGLVGGAIGGIWRFLNREHCHYLGSLPGGHFGGGDDKKGTYEDGDEGMEIPVPRDIKERLPWLASVQILPVSEGGEGSDRRTYGVRIRVEPKIAAAGGRLLVALVEKDGASSICALSSKPSEQDGPFDGEFSADWNELTIGLVAEV